VAQPPIHKRRTPLLNPPFSVPPDSDLQVILVRYPDHFVGMAKCRAKVGQRAIFMIYVRKLVEDQYPVVSQFGSSQF
jgi:hypothetical protein